MRAVAFPVLVLVLSALLIQTGYATSLWMGVEASSYVKVPFRYQSKYYYCGPACVEMVFAFFGVAIAQEEIADVARTDSYYSGTYTEDMVRAGHFSNLSTSIGDEMPGSITGYTRRKTGYATFEKWGTTIDEVKTLIDEGYPPILLMWQDEFHMAGHYRVAIGYNDTHVVFHDPWNKVMWGGTYGGANLTLTYSTVLDFWGYSGCWAMTACPWTISIEGPSSVYREETFTITANITYPCPTPFTPSDYPATYVNATLNPSSGLDFASGETAAKPISDLQGGQSTSVSWSMVAESSGMESVNVTVGGLVNGSVYPLPIYPGYDYEDRIGGSSTHGIEVVGFLHDVAVIGASSLKSFVGEGLKCNVEVWLANQGEFTENFNITLYANETAVGFESIVVERDQNVSAFICGSVFGLAKGNYTVSVYVTPVLNETDLADNELWDGWFFITAAGDANGDRAVNILDCILLANHFNHVNGNGHTNGSKDWSDCMNCDLNGDLRVNVLDCIVLANHFGEAWA